MKTITSITYPALALFAFACFAAAAGVLGAESIDEGLNLPVQSETVNVSPELAGVETQTVLGLYNPSTHETRIWYMNNNVHVGTVAGPHVPAGWIPVSAADFNGDGHIDVLLFNPTTGQTWIGYLFGARIGNYGPTLPSGRQLVATADFNQDGHPDFVLNLDGSSQTRIWYMNNNIHIGTASGPTLPVFFGMEAVVVGASDFNGDGNPDYLVFVRYPLYAHWIFYMNNNVFVGEGRPPRTPLGWSLAGATDFNRDGNADFLLYRLRTRRTAIWYMNNGAVVGGASGPIIPSGWDLFAP